MSDEYPLVTGKKTKLREKEIRKKFVDAVWFEPWIEHFSLC